MPVSPPVHPEMDGRLHQPLLKDNQPEELAPGGLANGALEGRTGRHHTRRPTFRSKSPQYVAEHDTRRKYIIASGFLLLSLASFVVQTETAVYIQHELHWDKPYCML